MEWLLVLSEVCCHIQTLTHLRKHAHTQTRRRLAASTLCPKRSGCHLQYMFCARKCRFGSSCFFFAARAKSGSEPLLYLNCCPGWKQTNMTMLRVFSFNDPILFRTQSCRMSRCWKREGRGSAPKDVGCWKPTWKRRIVTHLCVLIMSVRVHANESFVSL